VNFDHIGTVAPDLGAMARWYMASFGWRVAWIESVTRADPSALGLPEEKEVVLHGVLIHAGRDDPAGPYWEIHQFLTPTGTGHRRHCDLGVRSIGVLASDIPADIAHLGERGLRLQSPPQSTSSGPLAGTLRAIGSDPWGNQIELLTYPPAGSPPSSGLSPLALVSLVVSDVSAAYEWYRASFGCQPAFGGIQPDADIDGSAIGMASRTVVFQHALLTAGSVYLRLEHYPGLTRHTARRVCDTGFSHICFRVPHITRTAAQLRAKGAMKLYDTPRHIATGGLKGRWWVYGHRCAKDNSNPVGEVIELCDHPDPPFSCLMSGRGTSS
jgi:catechol 2,3-dioxygenase-like lactoylglutathione lyase family enzyme